MGASSDQQLAASIIPPENPSMASSNRRLRRRVQKTAVAPIAVTALVNKPANNACKVGWSDANNSRTAGNPRNKSKTPIGNDSLRDQNRSDVLVAFDAVHGNIHKAQCGSVDELLPRGIFHFLDAPAEAVSVLFF